MARAPGDKPPRRRLNDQEFAASLPAALEEANVVRIVHLKWISLLALAGLACFLWPSARDLVFPRRSPEQLILEMQRACQRGDWDAWLGAIDPEERPVLEVAVQAGKRLGIVRNQLALRARSRYGDSAGEIVRAVPGGSSDQIGVLALLIRNHEIIEPRIDDGPSPEWKEAVLSNAEGTELRVHLHSVGGEWHLRALPPDASPAGWQRFEADCNALARLFDALSRRLETVGMQVSADELSLEAFLAEMKDVQALVAAEVSADE